MARFESTDLNSLWSELTEAVRELTGLTDLSDDVKSIHDALLDYTELTRDKTGELTPGDYLVGIASCARYLSTGNVDGDKLTLSEIINLFKDYESSSYLDVDSSGYVYGFKEGNSRSKLVIPSRVKGIKVTGISNAAFKNDLTIKHIIIHEGVSSIGTNAFYDCKNVETLQLPSTLRFINSGAFVDNLKLKELIIPRGTERIDEGAFGGCENLESIIVDKDNEWLSDDGRNYVRELSSGTLIVGCNNTTFPAYDSTIITRIGNNAFEDCHKISKVILPISVKSVGKYAFHQNESLEIINLPHDCVIHDTAFDSTYIRKILLEDTGYCFDLKNKSQKMLSKAMQYYYNELPLGTGRYWTTVDGVPTIYEDGLYPLEDWYAVSTTVLTQTDVATGYVPFLRSGTWYTSMSDYSAVITPTLTYPRKEDGYGVPGNRFTQIYDNVGNMLQINTHMSGRGVTGFNYRTSSNRTEGGQVIFSVNTDPSKEVVPDFFTDYEVLGANPAEPSAFTWFNIEPGKNYVINSVPFTAVEGATDPKFEGYGFVPIGTTFYSNGVKCVVTRHHPTDGNTITCYDIDTFTPIYVYIWE